ncbi:MAG: F0F1 ATP synthase subunit A [Firmicutes bacterium]|nr:F0F1 ATP synthase subunit A [Bacillota bacterium]
MEFDIKTAFYLGNIPITETVVNTWFIMGVMIAFAVAAARKFTNAAPDDDLGTFGLITEMVVDGLNKMISSTMGDKAAAFGPYIGTLFSFLLLANLSGLIGLRPPTADLNTTLAFASISFVLIQGTAIRSKGILGYFKGFFEPLWFLFPLNVVGELATPISLSFRLFGNILGGMIIMSLLYQVVPVLIPAPLHIYFDIFSGVLQAFIFTMLTMVFISSAG